VKLVLAIVLFLSTTAYGMDENYPVATKITLKEVLAQRSDLQASLETCQVDVKENEKKELYFFGSGVLLGVVLGLLKR
jgi:hypothetical protein